MSSITNKTSMVVAEEAMAVREEGTIEETPIKRKVINSMVEMTAKTEVAAEAKETEPPLSPAKVMLKVAKAEEARVNMSRRVHH
jgi:hypothetical protein